MENKLFSLSKIQLNSLTLYALYDEVEPIKAWLRHKRRRVRMVKQLLASAEYIHDWVLRSDKAFWNQVVLDHRYGC